MNNIFTIFKDDPIQSIDEIKNEFTLKRLLFSIEPTLPKVELNDASDYGVRYGNFVSIISSVTKYLKTTPEQFNFTDKVSFDKNIDISALLNGDINMAVLVCEMAIFLSSISSNKEAFNALENCNEQCLSLYISITEKYSKKYGNSEDNNMKNVITENHRNSVNSNEDNNTVNKSTLFQYEMKIEELNRDVEEKISQINTMNIQYNELENKYNEAISEINILKENQERSKSISDDLISEKTLNLSLQNEIKMLRMQNENCVKDYEDKLKNVNFRLNMANEKLLLAENKIESYSELKKENEKMKERLKGLNMLKDKEQAIKELQKQIESKNNLIDQMTVNQKSLNKKIEQLNFDMQIQKNEIRAKDEEKNKLMQMINDLKSDNQRLDHILKEEDKKESYNLNDLIDEKDMKNEENINNINQNSKVGIESSGINLSSIEPQEDLRRKVDDLEKQVEEYKSIISDMNMEKAKYLDADEKYNLKQKSLEKESQNFDLEIKNMELVGKIKNLENEIEKYKNNTEGDNIIELKEKLQSQNELIQSLQSKLEYMKKNEDNILKDIPLDENIEKQKDRIKQLEEEIEKSNLEKEEIKNNSILEHNLISASIYELALQFMNLKQKFDKTSDIPNKGNTSERSNKKNLNETWLETEKKKNFPNDFYI